MGKGGKEKVKLRVELGHELLRGLFSADKNVSHTM